MGASGGATPPRGQSRAAATGTGNSPNAKRPTTIDPITTPDGPLIEQAQASKEIYALKRQLQAIENWANGVNASLADHASHFDLQRDKTELNRLQSVVTFSGDQESSRACGVRPAQGSRRGPGARRATVQRAGRPELFTQLRPRHAHCRASEPQE